MMKNIRKIIVVSLCLLLCACSSSPKEKEDTEQNTSQTEEIEKSKDVREEPFGEALYNRLCKIGVDVINDTELSIEPFEYQGKERAQVMVTTDIKTLQVDLEKREDGKWYVDLVLNEEGGKVKMYYSSKAQSPYYAVDPFTGEYVMDVYDYKTGVPLSKEAREAIMDDGASEYTDVCQGKFD